MGKKNNNTPAVNPIAGVNKEVVAPVVRETPVIESPSIVENPAVETSVAVESPSIVENPAVETSAAVESHEATIVPSGRFIAEDGNEFEFTVGSFLYQGKKYTKEEALSDHPDVLEHLASIKSFILKKV